MPQDFRVRTVLLIIDNVQILKLNLHVCCIMS